MSDIPVLIGEKIKAFLLHLMLSIGLLAIILLTIYFIWYPYPLLKAVGGEHIFLLLVVIDVILGPILTFIVYKKHKKTLKFDLAVIGLIQVAALLYGIHSLLLAKPSWIVFNQNKFELVQYNQIIVNDIQGSQFTAKLWSKPNFVAVELSSDVSKRSEQILQEVLTGISLAQQPENYVSLTSKNKQLISSSKSMKYLFNFNDISEVKKVLSKCSTATRWLPLKTNGLDMVVLLNDNGDVIKIVDLRPWH